LCNCSAVGLSLSAFCYRSLRLEEDAKVRISTTRVTSLSVSHPLCQTLILTFCFFFSVPMLVADFRLRVGKARFRAAFQVTGRDQQHRELR